MNNNQSKQELLLTSLLKFYGEDPKYLNTLNLISKQKTSISLREMDYTVTNYGDKNKVIYKLKNNKTFNLYLEYKNQLKAYSKKFFDPFCRRDRIFIEFNTLKIINIKKTEIDYYKDKTYGLVTTVGQLNFFRWAITNEVIDFCFKNKELIDREMESVMKKKNNSDKNISDKISDTSEVKVIIEFDD